MLSIKAKLRGTSHYGEDLKSKIVVLPISVGQPYHEGEKFLSTVELINKRFMSCDIIIADTLQRKNLKVYDPEILKCLKEFQNGSDWIERNKKALSEIKIPYKIIRWHECLESQIFHARYNEIIGLYNLKQEYYNFVQEDVEKFLSRQKEGNINLSFTEELEDYCASYIIEETTVFLSYFIKENYDIVLYPSAIPSSIDYIRKTIKNNAIESFILYFKKKY